MKTLHTMTEALGPPQALRLIGDVRRPLAAVGRWRHAGGSVDLSDADTRQLIFNVSGGQLVEQRRGGCVLRKTARAGSIALVGSAEPTSVSVVGQADVVQVFLTSELLAAVSGRRAPLPQVQTPTRGLQLQAAAAKALVALARGHASDASDLESVVRQIACEIIDAAPIALDPARGGLSPTARRRVSALMDARVESGATPSLKELAAAAGLSVHHFIKAHRHTEQDTPYARTTERRIDRAMALLLCAGARVDEVGEVTGFSSPSHFISSFRRRVGVTPGALRDAARVLR